MRFPHQLSWLINNPLRRLLISPEVLAKRLMVPESGRILELGPGSGYFSAALAAQVPRGRLELFDIQPKMLAKASRRLTRRGCLNVGYTVGDAGKDLPFSDGQFDAILLASVLGEVHEPGNCLKSLYRVLSLSGILAVHEALPDPDRIPFERLQNLVEEHGFRLVRRWGPGWNYLATFAKSESLRQAGMTGS